MKDYNIHWNKTRKVWIGKIKVNGEWKQKWCPKTYGENAELGATQFLVDWARSSFGAGGEVRESGAKTLAVVAPKWLSMREQDSGTKPNTYRGFRLAVNNWILDNDNFAHKSLQNLDIETLSVETIAEWIKSIESSGKTKSTVIQYASCLKTLLEDAEGWEWIDLKTGNPFIKKPIKKIIKQLYKDRSDNNVITILTKEQVETLLTGENAKVSDSRRIRYLTSIATGLRDGEISALTWHDIKLNAPIPYIDCSKQLLKIGTLPYIEYEKSKDKLGIYKLDNAIVSNPKYNSKRMIPIHPLLLSALKYFSKGKDSSLPVFSSAYNDYGKLNAEVSFCKLDKALIRKDLTRLNIATECNGENITLHSLRHTFATLLNDADVYETRVGVLLGHKARSVTSSHYTAKTLQSALQSILALPLPKFLRLRYCKIEQE